MPEDGAVQFAFDRYLLPTTVTRQAVVLTDASSTPVSSDLAPIVTYDPIARTVTLLPPTEPWLVEGTSYKVFFKIPQADDDTTSFGLRAIDRATLYPGQQLEFAFLVGPKTGQATDPTVGFCTDILPIFAAKCSAGTGGCHSSADVAAESLVLTTSTGVAATALGRLSQEMNRGSSTGITTGTQSKFGIDMPVIDPGSPGNSWLLYKIELAGPPGPITNTANYLCQSGQTQAPSNFAFTPLAPGAQQQADPIEHAILSDYVLGQEMPYPVANAHTYESLPLTFQEREKVRVWISSLAPGEALPECGGCIDDVSSDAGAADAGTSDAGASDAGESDADASDASDQ